ncbi:DUF488 family protein [Cryobacterium sp. TMT1-21]|uniref:DUF488 family protein n=1 Tax=Cryobacterium shii TaxID=1259235 RepID=A0AAQ2C5L4_9MICO|nr:MULTISPECIES: DUF488 family protein [Cryobacterium]TFC46388.1 DUF488 family protein [Cryobacterium shii]TFC80726.1 DUF488 family protein [Cryobacterium sp. TmT2-59]TFD17311.1 DUF488 family protein [Cryobacterium sp. TMT1-21]TFD39960.1 DUF488 family protein [Cryobacterium sp. TMT2-10]
MGILIKRVYDEPAESDGVRVLVDRLWPRGVSKEHARLDLWLKDVAPSPDLRTWWNHDPARLAEFAERYTAELGAAPQTRQAVAELRALLARNTAAHTETTLVYGARDPVVNHARVLAAYLADNPEPRDPQLPNRSA